MAVQSAKELVVYQKAYRLESANAASRLAADSPLARRLQGFLTE